MYLSKKELQFVNSIPPHLLIIHGEQTTMASDLQHNYKK